MKSQKEAKDPRKITKSTSPNGKMVKKKKIDAKTQRLLDSSRKLGRRLISMDIQSEKKDKKQRRKMEQLTILTTYMFLKVVINSFYKKSFCDTKRYIRYICE